MAGLERLSLVDEDSDEVSTYGTNTSSGSRSRSSWKQHRWARHSRTRISPRINAVEEGANAGPVVSSDGFQDYDVSSRSSRVSAGGRRAVPCPRLPSCKVMCSQRIPKGKAFILILVMLVIERYILYGAIHEVLDLIPELDSDSDSTGLGTFLRVFLLYCVSRILYPVGGFIADVYMGRCRVIHMSLWFYWIAFAILTIANVLQGLQRGSYELYYDIGHISWLYTRVLPGAAYVFMILAAGGFEPTLIPFGADQLEAAGSNELSSYFYWYYFAIQIGPLLNIFVDAGLSMLPLPVQQVDTLQVLATIIVATCGLVLHKTLEHWYFKNIVRENCIKLVGKVLWYVAKVNRRMPVYMRAFRYGEGKIKRIDLAKRRYDGIFTGDQVEDVKTFCLLCLIIFCLGFSFFSQSGVFVMMAFRVNATIFEATANSSNVAFLQTLSPNMWLIANILTALMIFPLVNHIFIPCLPCISMRGRMAVGMVISVCAVVSAGVIENSLHGSEMEPLYTLLLYVIPTVLGTIPETLIQMSALEFIYAQSPESMKGMLTGLLFLVFGLFSGGSTVLFYLYLSSPYTPNYATYYWMLLVFSVFGLVTYVIAACLYVNRRRPTNFDTEEI